MDTKRGILFLVVTLIIIVSIYYIVKMVKGRTPSRSPPSPSPSPSDQTGEISISDLKFERTLNPDKSNSKGDDGIVGYTIEYDEGINFKELSKNVTFTLGWKNNIGFTGNVTGFNIEHHVKGDDDYKLGQSIKFLNTTDDTDIKVNNFEENNSIQIISDGNYSVVGENRFKIFVIMNDGTVTEIYDGTVQDGTSHGIVISKDELGATLSMTNPETVTYIPVTNTFSKNYSIKRVKYSISNDNSSLNFAGSGSIYLMPASPGSVDSSGDKIDVDTLFFKYELGENQYLLQDGKKGKWNEKTNRERNSVFDDTKHDNRMFVAFYDKKENENIMQLRAPVMGYGLGGKFLTSDESGNLKLIDISENYTVKETEFNNSYWKFTEVEGDPVNCQGTYDDWSTCSNKCGSGTQTKTFDVSVEPKNYGNACPPSTISQSCVDQSGCPPPPPPSASLNPYNPGGARH